MTSLRHSFIDRNARFFQVEPGIFFVCQNSIWEDEVPAVPVRVAASGKTARVPDPDRVFSKARIRNNCIRLLPGGDQMSFHLKHQAVWQQKADTPVNLRNTPLIPEVLPESA